MDDTINTPLLTSSKFGGDTSPDYSAIKSLDYRTFPFTGSRGSDVIAGEELSRPDSNLPEVTSSPSELTIKLYKRRWYILLLYSLMSGMQGLIWNTWSPISNSVEKAFDWNNGDISLLANWGPIMSISLPIFAWMLHTKGLRWSVATSMFLVCLGAGVRCIPVEQPSTTNTWLMHTGQILNGLGGPVGTAAMPVVSATWFPPHERTTATAIPVVVKYIALAGSFLLGPLLVPDPSKQNCTNFTVDGFDADCGGIYSGITVDDVKKNITFYLQLEAGLAGFVFLLILVYFPKKPPTPPCVSASVQREDFLHGLKVLLRNGNFWLINLTFLLAFGIGNGWMAVLTLVLIPTGASQKEAGWIGFYTLLSTGVVMLLSGRFGDYFTRHMKRYITFQYLISAVMYLWFALIGNKLLSYSTASIYASVIIGQTAAVAPSPLVNELTCDIAFPVGEGTACGIQMLISLLAAVVILFIMMVPNIGTTWLTWSMVGAMVSSTLLMMLVKEKHHRLEIDVTVIHDSKDNKEYLKQKPADPVTQC